MSNKYLANIDKVPDYKVYLEFTDLMDPNVFSDGEFPLASLKAEIEANSLSNKAYSLREEYGRIPYGSPLYICELHVSNKSQILYIGQTVLQRIKERIEKHSRISRILAKYVNDNKSNIYFRLCSRFDLIYDINTRRAIIDVRDVIKGFWLAVHKCDFGDRYNIGGETVYFIKDIIEILKELTDVKFEISQDPKLIRPTDEPIIYGDSTRFKKKTGWSQKINIKETLQDMLDYWRGKL